MSTERYIFTKEELEAYEKWLKKLNDDFPKGKTVYDELIVEWYRENPSPLPSPVIVPSDEEIMDFANDYFGLQNIEALGFIKGFKHLRYLIFGF